MEKRLTFTLGHKVDMTFNLISPGTFIMGDEDEFNELGWAEKPKHEVILSKHFYLSKCPVTRQQWQYVMGYKTYEYEGEIHLPAVNMTWKEAITFTRKTDIFIGMNGMRSLIGAMPLRKANAAKLPARFGEKRWEKIRLAE